MSRFSKNNWTRSRNPFMKEDAYRNAANQPLDAGFDQMAVTEQMTVQGAINKTFILTGLLLITAIYSFSNPSTLFMWGGAIGGLVIVLIASFRPQSSGVLAPIYALLEGLFVGSISGIYAIGYEGIVFNAICLTIATLFMMLFIYKSGIIKVNNKFRTGVVMATGAIALVYLLSFVLSFFGINMPYLHDGGMIGIGISVVIIGVAALNLLLDFDNFERGEQYGAPRYMEWFSAMGLLITLVWLYIEFLRLLAIFAND